MSYYFPNPNLWMPEEEDRLLAVLVPEGQTEIASQRMYLTYLARRVDWLIEQWMEATEATPWEVERMLDRTLSQLAPAQSTPTIADEETGETRPLPEWRQAWAEAIVFHNNIIQEKLGLLGIDFPITVITNEQEKESLLWMFDSEEMLEPNLEEWLSSLTVHLRPEKM